MNMSYPAIINTMPDVSVIIPVYNRPELLLQAAESVFVQSFADFELIIVDDGSTDQTPAVAAELAGSVAAAGRCRVISVSHTGFPGAARNRGVEAAEGAYIAFLDSDDTWQPHKLERQLAFMQVNPECRISHTREKWLRGEKIVSQKGQKHRREGDIFSDALKKCIIGPSTTMMERSLLLESGGFHERLEIAEDYEYWLRITSSSPVGYVNEELTVKRAGGWPQLSEKYGKIEWFRLCALAGLLGIGVPGFDIEPRYLGSYSWPGFSPDVCTQAAKELVFKCGVWAAGCRKRKRFSEAAVFGDIIERIGGQAENGKGSESD